MGGGCPSPFVEKGLFLCLAGVGGSVLRVTLSAKPLSSPWVREFLWLETLSAVAMQTRFKGWSNAAAGDLDLTVLKLCFSALALSLLLIQLLYL